MPLLERTHLVAEMRVCESSGTEMGCPAPYTTCFWVFGINHDTHSLNLAAGNFSKSYLLAPDLPAEPGTAEAAR